MIKSLNNLDVDSISYKLAMEVFNLSLKFPKDERFSLTDQIRRSSRSITGNISEGWGKRKYEQLFKRHLIDSLGSLEETKTWLSFSLDCKYISREDFDKLYSAYDILGSKIFKLHLNWKSR